MAPQENGILNSETQEERLHRYGLLFSLPVPAMKQSNRKRARKRKSIEAEIQLKIPLKKEKFQDDNSIEVIDLDSDSPIDINYENVNDDVILKNEPEEIVISGSSDCECIETVKSKDKLLDVDSEPDTDNIIINTNQPMRIDKIIDSALKMPNKHSDIPAVVNTYQDGNRIRRKIHWTEAEGYPKSWTKEMIRFYTEPCERNRNFDYVEILEKLNTKTSDWWISRADLICTSKTRRSFNRCRRCDKRGHHESQCPKSYVCSMCGEFNHRITRCPYSYCFSCGRETKRNTKSCDHCLKIFNSKRSCKLCGQLYHDEATCPSTWRRCLVRNSTHSLTLNSRKFCYNCAGKGHFGFECPLVTDTEYPPENPLVTSGLSLLNLSKNTDSNVIFLSKDSADFLHSEKGNDFLQYFSTKLDTRVEVFSGVKDYVKITGGHQDAMKYFKTRLEAFKSNHT